jgi:hypothetical protein
MSSNPDEAIGAPLPPAVHPDRGGSWTHHPAAAHPLVSRPVPAPVTTRPDIARPRRDGHSFHSHRRRRSGHDDILNDRRYPSAAAHNFSSNFSGCCCHDRRWRRRRDNASTQCKSCYCDCVNVCSHIVFFRDSFCPGRVALFELNRNRQDRVAIK